MFACPSPPSRLAGLLDRFVSPDKAEGGQKRHAAGVAMSMAMMGFVRGNEQEEEPRMFPLPLPSPARLVNQSMTMEAAYKPCLREGLAKSEKRGKDGTSRLVG